MIYTRLEMLAFFLFYSFVGWIFEVLIVSFSEKKFCNRGYFNAPFSMKYGFMCIILVLIYPTLKSYWVVEIIMTLAVTSAVSFLAGVISRKTLNKKLWAFESYNILGGTLNGLIFSVCLTAIFWVSLSLIHPFVYLMIHMTPVILIKIICYSICIILLLDQLTIFYAVKKIKDIKLVDTLIDQAEKRKIEFGKSIYGYFWRRLNSAYPHIEDEPQSNYIFAEGICFDKVIWVFLICALCGDLIETVYMRLISGIWMSRTSVLYGPFSIVWGFGAVILTVTLERLSDKKCRYLFFAGAILGGTYEYMCSVFTEVFFGAIFWDYSKMPFNIGGRTNLVFCVFWGVIAVLWVKLGYPKLSLVIQKIPNLVGKIITWILILLMLCNALLSAAAMIRYTERRDGKPGVLFISDYLDDWYPDNVINKTWPNMKIKDK